MKSHLEAKYLAIMLFYMLLCPFFFWGGGTWVPMSPEPRPTSIYRWHLNASNERLRQLLSSTNDYLLASSPRMRGTAEWGPHRTFV